MNARRAFLRVRSVLMLSLGLCLSLAWTTPMPAGSVVTDCTENGLDAALVGGPVTFNCGGTHAPATISIISPFTITTGLTIDGTNGGHLVTLNAISNTVIFSVTDGASLTLANLILQSNGSTMGDGGCLYTNGALLLNNVEMMHCQAGPGSHGGALYVDNEGSAALISSSVHD